MNNMNNRHTSIFLLGKHSLPKIYSEAAQSRIGELTRLKPKVLHYESWEANRHELADVDFIFSGWGMHPMTEDFLSACPNLKYVFYGSGSIRSFYTEEAQSKGIRISSAWRANAVPTAEYAHALIILALKKFYRSTRINMQERSWNLPPEAAGIYKSTVGIVSLGMVGRLVAEHLRDLHSLNVIAYDPYVSEADALSLGVELTSLEDLFAQSDVVSLHAPDLPETVELVSEALLRSMKPHATLINTARGKLIDEAMFAKVLTERKDLDAVLDVTRDEPNNANCPLWDLPNVVISPHIAGSINHECQRMGEYMVEELERYLAGKPMLHEVTPELLLTMA
ncbi:MAG TPA: glycerate dehydrogenase [Opitutae bacterium]|nr:glycerate dehydrogenase [Puniceicoccaceae bacterium]HBR93857.1 glycerate dehydrogenase [Opitutae bacterium]|tara:strand:- start:10916 stop:11929 length:1014 start_codon:yes stop_codon:yes gene_type:complete